MPEKITAAQRKYFDNRIDIAINDKINVLKQQDAANVMQISAASYVKYLKLIGIDKTLARYKKVDKERVELSEKLYSVYNECRRSLDLKQYESDMPSVYQGSSHKDYTTGFRHLCQKAALKSEGITPAGKEIARLKEQMNNAKDVLYGINELPDLLKCVNSILKDAEVPLLGDGKDE